MTKDKLQTQAYQRMALIEEQCDGYVSPELQAYWLLNYLIATGFKSYFDFYGPLPILTSSANAGRLQIGLGPLSGFEIDTIHLLLQKIHTTEDKHEQRNSIRLITNSNGQ